MTDDYFEQASTRLVAVVKDHIIEEIKALQTQHTMLMAGLEAQIEQKAVIRASELVEEAVKKERERIAELYGEYRYVTKQWFGYPIGEKTLRFYLLPHTQHKKGDDEAI